MKTNFLKKSAFAVLTLTTASFYFAQEVDKEIEEVVLVGVADIAKDRKTPVAVSTIKESAIVEKLGNQEFPEILNTTPSVYATKSGGGFGDSKINIRGFSQENIAVMVNGMPVNDMETGKVYWSNWTGLSDVTSAMQVQRGLGASKLAIASVGGTINIVTRAADKKRAGTLSVGVGNDGYHKSLFSYNTGKGKSGWSSSILMSRTAGAMYADGTEFEGYNYYFALGFQPSRQHDFQLTITGAPQWHNQRLSSIKISDAIKYGNGVDKPNRRYNSDWGYITGADGISREYTFRRNYYHKPVMSFNWDWKMNKASKLSTVLYASFGRGGGTGAIGRVDNKSANDFRNAEGIIDFDRIVTANSLPTAKGALIRRASINSHNWLGVLSNFQHKINENLNFSIGFDGRYYKGYHYQVASDLLGASSYADKGDKNNPNRTITRIYSPNPSWNPFSKNHNMRDRISYNNEGEVLWYGGFGQLEYTADNFSAFVQGAVSNQGFKRVDHFIIDGATKSRGGKEMPKETKFKNLVGFNVKGGLNYNINENHNVFANAGYYERQPFFTGVYRGNENITAENLTNEKILGLELGYGFRSSVFNANVNLYRTTWRDRYERKANLKINDTRVFAELNNIDELHQGVELDAQVRINGVITLNGVFSYGDWRYLSNANSELFREDDTSPFIYGGGTNKATLYLDDVKVGDAAQLTTSLGLTFSPVRDLNFDASWRYVDNLYSRIDPFSFAELENAKKGVLRLPSYNLLDLGLSYKLRLKNNQSFTLRGNVYNVLDTTYIAESYTSNHSTDKSILYKGVDVSNQVYFGYGRTWSASLTFNF